MKKLAWCLKLLSILALSATAFLGGSAAAAPIIGAIRWDGYTGSGDTVGAFEEAALSPPEYRYRLPFYAKDTWPTATVVENTQAQMDQDITYAHNAGIDYWAFDYYTTAEPWSEGRKLYLSSTLPQSPNYLNYCLIFTPGSYAPSNSDLVADFQDTRYQTVLGGCPLLYLLGAGNWASADVSAFRTQCTNAGVQNPYIVLMGSPNGSPNAASLGCDANSEYWQGSVNACPYTGVMGLDQSDWESFKSMGSDVVPLVSMGTDPRPRMIQAYNPSSPGFDDSVNDGYGATQYAAKAAPYQKSAHLEQAEKWLTANAGACPANTALLYAWNEISECGGALTPTLYDGTQSCDAVASILVAGTSGPDLALQPSCTYSSSSNLNANTTAAMACDGIYSTHWKAATGQSYNSQWVQVNFNSTQTFSTVVLAEPSYQTTSFQIQYYNGSSWQTALTESGSDLIGPSSAPSTYDFWPVTGTAVKIVYTGGSGTPTLNTFEVYNTTDFESTPNLCLGLPTANYTAASQWDPTQASEYAFDGMFNTDWQAAQGSTYGNQWIQVNFANPNTTFDKAVLAEYGARTYGYEIQYLNSNSQWETAYTGEQAGSAYNPTPIALTNAYLTSGSPITVVTSTNNWLYAGETVVISGVQGLTAANGTWTISAVSNTPAVLR